MIAESVMVAGLLLAPGDPTPVCATQNEWGQVTLFQTPGQIENIIGNDGTFVQTPNPDTFARTYNLCNGWQPDGDFGKVWFEQDNRLSYDKAIIHV